MSTFSSDKENEAYLVLRQQFESLQARIVAERTAIIPLRRDASAEQQQLRVNRLREATTKLAKDEVELVRLHKLLHPGEE